MSIVRRLGRALARLNRRFAGAAAATSSSTTAANPGVDAIGVKTVLGEIEQETAAEAPPEEQPPAGDRG